MSEDTEDMFEVPGLPGDELLYMMNALLGGLNDDSNSPEARIQWCTHMCARIVIRLVDRFTEAGYDLDGVIAASQSKVGEWSARESAAWSRAVDGAVAQALVELLRRLNEGEAP